MRADIKIKSKINRFHNEFFFFKFEKTSVLKV